MLEHLQLADRFAVDGRVQVMVVVVACRSRVRIFDS